MEIPDLDFNLNNLEMFDSNSTSRNVFNFSMEEAYAIITKEHKILDAYFLKALVAIYVILMVTGLFSNTMVWLVVARRAQMRTPRNFYVVNLTVSDISLCLISMPFTLVNFIETQWNLGLVLCKLVPVIQGCNIFVSTGTVMAIALDRYFTVCRSCGAAQDKYRVLLSIALIWIISCLFTFPILFYQVLEEENIGGLLVIRRCIEKWPSSSMRAAYTFGLLVFQLVIPILVLAGVHVAIANHLNAHTFVPNDRPAKNLLKKSFLRGVGGGGGGGCKKKNVLHLRLDESTVIIDDGPTKSIIGNGSDSTLYNIQLNDALATSSGGGDDNDDDDTSDTVVVGQKTSKNNNSGSGESRKGEKLSNTTHCSAVAAAATAAASEISSTVVAVATTAVGNNVSHLSGVSKDKSENGNGGGGGENCTIVSSSNDGGASNNARRSPLNVKFKSNIGVCITFREFCQLTGGGKAAIEQQQKQQQQQLELGEKCKKQAATKNNKGQQDTTTTTTTTATKNEMNDKADTLMMMTMTETRLGNESMDKDKGSKVVEEEEGTSGADDDERGAINGGGGQQQGQLTNKTNSMCHTPGSASVVAATVKSQMVPPPTLTPIIPLNNNVISKRTKKELARNRRTTIILLSVAVIFTISWMPWHLLTLWADLHPNFTSTSNLYMFFAIAHILAMTSAVTNAILYGWFNTNLRRELVQMLSSWIKR